MLCLRKLIILFYCILLVGCASMYAPSVPNIATFNKANELHLEGGVSMQSFNYYAGYSPLNHICIQANGFGSFDLIMGQEFTNNFEGAIGVYNIRKPVISNQILIGYGKGYGEYEFDEFGGHKEGEYDKLYLQINFNVNKRKEHLHILSFRLSNVNYAEKYIERPTPYPINYSNNFKVVYSELYFSGQEMMSSHFNFIWHLGLILKSENNDVIYTIPVNVGVGFALKLFNEEKKENK